MPQDGLPPEYWYVRTRGQVTIALCYRTDNSIIYWLPGEPISKTFWLSEDPEWRARNPEIEFVVQIPDHEAILAQFGDGE